MKLALTASVMALSSAVSAAVVSLPITTFRNPEHLNAESLTRRYLQKRASTTSPLTNIEQDLIYTIPFSLGTPAQSFNVIIDTGSPVTWVASNTCSTSGCLKTQKFNCAASSTCKKLNTPFNATYVSGQGVSGEYVGDLYTIGSLQFRGAAGIVNVDNAELPDTVDGIMGLWYYAQGSVVPILNVLKNTTALDQNVIGVYLEPSDTTKNSPGGEITFGGVNTARFSGSVTYTNCLPGRPWTIPLNSVNINGKAISIAANTKATIDTGTTAMLMPKTAADAINSAIPGAVQAPNAQDAWFLPCAGSAPVTFTFGQFTATIPYKDIAMQSTAQRTSAGLFCQSAAMFPVGPMTKIDEWLIGDAFLKNVYSVFDFENNANNGGRIGFAALGSGGSSDVSSAGSALKTSSSLGFLVQGVVAFALAMLVM
ncbi:hypothetical protein BGZ81_010311 [Podila clonocystis]|nr:hypothetical protein BGZ81_010311 [Podila clonocystis]